MINIPRADILNREYTAPFEKSGQLTEYFASVRERMLNTLFHEGRMETGVIVPAGLVYDYSLPLYATPLSSNAYVQRMRLTEATGTPNGKLVLFVHGHDGGTPNRDTDFAAVANAPGGDLLARGYDIVEIFMPGVKALNSDGDTISPFTSLTGGTYHDEFHVMMGNAAWQFYFHHITALLNTLAPNYDKIIMMGKSGGGWYSSIYPFLDSRIDMAVGICGTAPAYLAREYSSLFNTAVYGDYEQHAPELYGEISVVTMYAAIANRIPHFQFHNTNDTIVQFAYYATKMDEINDFIRGKGFTNFTAVSVTGTAGHLVPSQIWPYINNTMDTL